jgi:hypothetical protein
VKHSEIPHLRIVVTVSAFVLLGFAAVSAYILGFTDDELTKGNITGTWQNFALLAVGFWLGSSSAGKAKDETPPKVQIEQPPGHNVPVEEMKP